MVQDRLSIFLNWLPLIFGLLVGMFLVNALGTMPTKWVVFIVGGLIALSILILVGTLTTSLGNSMLVLGILGIPTFLRITPFYRDGVPFAVLVNGFPVTITDVFIFPLMLKWIFDLMFNPEHRKVEFPKSWLVLMLLLLATSVISALFIAQDSFFSYSMIYAQLKNYFYALFLANTIKDEKTFKAMIFGFAGILAFEGLVVLEQRFLGVIFTAENLGRNISLKSKAGMASILRLAGTFDHPNNLAMYLNFIFPICGYYWLIEKRARVKFWIGVAIFLAVLAELGSGSRGGWLAIATAVTITAIFWLKKQGKNPVFGIGGMAVALVLIFGVLMAASETFRTRLTEGDAGTAEIRYPLMEVAQTMIEQNPYLGVGLANYTLEMRKYDYTNKQVTKDYDQPVHNTFMLLAAETGIPTLIFMAMLYLVWIKDSLLVFLRAKGVTAVVGIGVLAMLIGWVVHNQVNLSAPYDDVTLWILVGMVAAASRMARENKQIQTQR